MLSRAEDVEGVGLAVSGINDYKSYFETVGLGQGGGMGGSGAGNMSGGSGSDGKSLEDMFYQKEMEISKTAFTRQFTHGVIYAWVKLREQVNLLPLFFSYFAGVLLYFGYGWFGLHLFRCLFAGNTKYHVDRRVHCTEPKGEDRELYQCLLIVNIRGVFFVCFFRGLW